MAQSRLEKLETYMLSVMDGRRKSRTASFLRWLLRQLARIYNVIVQLRLSLYQHGIFRHHTLGCQVVSVGNLTVGGTGKTPIVEVFARSLQQSGRKVAVLSRGYKKAKPPLVVSDGERLLLDSATGGDEPYMLASNLPKVAVLVDKNRVKSGQYAIKKLDCDTLILDDGFQYLGLKHRLDIVLVDSSNPFDNGFTLPRGVLRERIKNIRRASFIFITKCDESGAGELKKQLRELNPDAEISECRHCPRYLQNVFTGEQKPLEALRDIDVAAISGIAAPGGFEDTLTRLGARVIYHKRYADHHRYTQLEIIDLINKSIKRGAKMIVTTEKDAVRFPKIERRDIPILFLRVEIEMLSGAQDFNECISRICFR